jgi:hypothetical protein
MRALLPAIVTLAVLAGCRSPGADCNPVDGWRQGGGGVAALPGCVNRDYREAHELGRSLHELTAERDGLDLRMASEPDAAAALRRRQRQLDIDIEAIQGLAVIEGWAAAQP